MFTPVKSKVCVDSESGVDVCIPESKRFESFLIVGVSGSGKTTMVYEPMLAKEILRENLSLKKFLKKWALQH